MKVKVYGAGSIGNHLTQASRRMGWDVTVVDRDKAALDRMKEDIYPTRYGEWDEGITLCESDKDPKGGFDVVFLGTPPDVRMKLATEVLSEKPRAIHLEKPLCTPDCKGLKEFRDACVQENILAFVGYDHAVSESATFAASLLKEGVIGNVVTIDVEFREHWAGIFGAHPWLSGPSDTYLGFTERGGGASGEHSHALHLWHFFAQTAGLGKWSKVSSNLHMVKKDGAHYDNLAAFILETDSGAVGRVVQDVVTKPPRKWARIQGDDGFIEWECGGGTDGADVVRWQSGDKEEQKEFPKSRPDDFYYETCHIDEVLKGNVKIEDSPIRLDSGVAVMEVLHTANVANLQEIKKL